MKPSDNEIEMLAAGFAIQHKNGLVRFAHALLDKYAPQASAEYVRNAALEQAAAVAKRISDKYAFGHYGNETDTADEIEREILALKTQADKDGCTCPSGDGSLRHPCAVHPPAPMVDEPPNLQGSPVDGSTEMQGDKDGGQQRAGDGSTSTGTWPMLSELHLHALMFAYNEGYSKAYDGRLFPNPFSENGSQAAAWQLGTDDGTEARAALSATQAGQGERDA